MFTTRIKAFLLLVCALYPFLFFSLFLYHVYAQHGFVLQLCHRTETKNKSPVVFILWKKISKISFSVFILCRESGPGWPRLKSYWNSLECHSIGTYGLHFCVCIIFFVLPLLEKAYMSLNSFNCLIKHTICVDVTFHWWLYSFRASLTPAQAYWEPKERLHRRLWIYQMRITVEFSFVRLHVKITSFSPLVSVCLFEILDYKYFIWAIFIQKIPR